MSKEQIEIDYILQERYEIAQTIADNFGYGDNDKYDASDFEWAALQVQNKGYRKQEWISVEERLPDNDHGTHWKDRKYYLVVTAPSGLMSVATYGYKEFGWWVDRCSQVLDEKTYRKVTHWMPLPELPKMKGGAE